MSTKRRLGRGLEALIPGIIKEEHEVSIKDVPISKIKANPYQPRTTFDEEKLKELANSIAEHGIIQPLIVSSEPDGYVLVAGERRLRAAQIIGLDKIPCLIKEVDPEKKIKLALVENLQRDDLNPIDEAKAYQCLMEEFGFTQEKMAKTLGKSRSAIANTLRLLSLPPDVQKELAAGNLSAGQARALLGIKDEQKVSGMAREIIRNKTNVRQVEKKVAALKTKKKSRPYAGEALFVKDLREGLQRHLGTRVKISEGSKKGMISIEFYGHEDLHRLAGLIIGKEQNLY